MIDWLSSIQFDEAYISEKVLPVFETQIKSEFEDYVISKGVDTITDDIYFPSLIETGDIDVISVAENITTTIVGTQVVVTIDVFASVDIMLYYNPDDEYVHFSDMRFIGSDFSQIVCSLTFTMDRESIIEDSLELENFEVVQKADFSFLRDYEDDRC